MTSKDPLKTVFPIGNVNDSSLALPSVNRFRSGEQRVREQVQSVRRIRSRQLSQSGSASLSPTSPSYDSVFGDGLKLQSGVSNGSIFFANGFSKALNLERNASWQGKGIYMGSKGQSSMAASTHLHEKRYAPAVSVAVGRRNTSRSEPDLVWQHAAQKRSVPPQRLLSSMGPSRSERTINQFVKNSFYQQQPVYTLNGISQNKAGSQAPWGRADVLKTVSKPTVTDAAPKNKGDSGLNGNSAATAMTMKEAVECLSKNDEAYQTCGASYIQHNAFIDDKAGEELLNLSGILPLVNLLRSPSSQVKQTASAALWNVSFKSDKIKEAIRGCGGVTAAAALLSDTDSAEMQKQLTGLLWNLSSAENLKPDMLKSALPALMERVILPYTTGEGRTGWLRPEPEVFFHATGCLRNLCSAKQSNRQALRKCQGLVDSLVRYIRGCVEAENPDDKSVENTVCVLHNLTFQLEAEAPALLSRITALGKTVSRNDSQDDSIGCFSPQNKPAQHEYQFDFAVVEDPQPSGAGWLFHSKTLQSYLSLLRDSQQEETQEACCGAMHNLTVREGVVSTVMSQTIVQKLNGLSVISPLIKSNKINLQRSVVSLVANLTKNLNCHSALARKVLPELLGVLREGTGGGNESDDTLATACHSANMLLMKEPEMHKYLLNSSLVNSLNDLSRNNYFPKTSKAAGLFLYNLWAKKDLQSYLKKEGMSKSSFVNDFTTAAHRAFQVVP